MIKAIIFDLDNCIFDTRTLGEGTLASVLAPLYASTLSEEIKKGVSDALWITRFEDVVVQYALPANVAELMRIECRRLEIPEGRAVKSCGDESYIPLLPVKKFLVTSGYRKFQTSKMIHIGIVEMFDGIFVDDMDDGALRTTKKQIFIEILESNDWTKEEVLVVGDNPRSELGVAKELGIKAIQTVRPGVQITSFGELKSFI
jgi:FMN phosphatase YigB (HAD superfamily)